MRLVASFPNRSKQSHREFILELTVGWTYLTVGKAKVRRSIENVKFVFDTGAHVTCIVQGMAQQLKLPNLDAETVLLRPVKGRSLKAKPTNIEILLEDKTPGSTVSPQWVQIECRVPWGSDAIDENLFGMEGVLSKYKFVLDRDKLEIYEP